MSKKYSFEESIQDNFGKKVAIGGLFSLVSQSLLLIVQILTTSLLARLLLPDDFGLVALSATFTGLIAVFKDLGLSMATVQRKQLTHEQVSNLFWLNVLFSLFLSLLVALGAPFIASFYGDDRLLPITIVSGFSLVIAGFTVQHQALLRRGMHFKTLAIVDFCSKLIGNAIGVVWAYLSHSYWALVFYPIFSASIYAICMWLFCAWRPSRFTRGAGTMSMVHFGKDMLHYGIVNYFARNADNFIVGKVAGTTDLGYYSRSYSLMLMPVGQLVSPLTGVVVSALSKLQDVPERYKHYYLEISKVLAIVSFALVSTMFLLSSEIIDIFLGEQWEEAKRIFMILCFAAFWQPLLCSTGWIYTSFGNTKRFVKWGYINSSLLIVSFSIGAIWNTIGVAYAYSIYMWIIVIPNFKYAFHDTPLSVSDILRQVVKPLIYTLWLVLVVYEIKYYWINSFNLMVRTVITCSIIIFLWGIYMLLDKETFHVIQKLKNR